MTIKLPFSPYINQLLRIEIRQLTMNSNLQGSMCVISNSFKFKFIFLATNDKQDLQGGTKLLAKFKILYKIK